MKISLILYLLKEMLSGINKLIELYACSSQCDLILCKYKKIKKIHYRMAKMQGEGKKVRLESRNKIKECILF